MRRIIFCLNGSNVAEAPADMTIEQLVKQLKHIEYKAYNEGMCCLDEDDYDDDYDFEDIDIIFDYDNVELGGRGAYGIRLRENEE